MSKAQTYRNAVMASTSLDLDKYYDLRYAKKDIQSLLSLENDELVGQMKYVINSLEELLEDTKTATEFNQIKSDLSSLRASVNGMGRGRVRLFR